MAMNIVRCAQCGHDFPAARMRPKDTIVCGCGMRIEGPGSPKTQVSGLALLLLAMAIVLLAALAALVPKLAP